MHRRPAAFARALLTAVLIAPATAVSAQTFHSTANGALGSIDPHWTVSASTRYAQFDAGLSAFGGGTFGNAYRWNINYDDWFGPRPGTVTPPLISNNAAASNGGLGYYTYFIFRQSFDLTGYDPATANLQFRWACDDVQQAVGWTPQFLLNGGALQGTGTCGSYALGDVVTLTSGFVNGVNVMDFYVQGNGLYDGFGLKTESFTASVVTTVPEPSTTLLIGAGLLSVGIAARRRRLAQDTRG